MNPVIKKLQYKDQAKILALNVPEQTKGLVHEFGCEADLKIKANYDFILFFAADMSEADRYAKHVVAALNHDGCLWFCYPKGSSKKYISDINRNKAWKVFEPFDFRPVSQVSIDEDWSALRFRDKALVR